MSLLDVLRGVMLDPAEQAVYDADPGAYLEQYGYQDVDPADLSEAFGLVADTLPADQARAAWTGESGPETPVLGDDTADFDGGGSDEVVLDPVVDDAGRQLDDEGDAAIDGVDQDDGEPSLSFGLGEEDDAGADSSDGAVDDLDGDGLFGTAAPDDAGAGALDDLDPGGTADLDVEGGFGPFTGDDVFDEAGGGLGEEGSGHDLDDTDDLAEIDGLGPVDHGPGDLDIGSF